MKFTDLTVEKLKERFDQHIQAILEVLQPYKEKHPRAEITISELDVLTIRVRIIDPDFENMNWFERDAEVWPLLRKLHDEIYLNLSMVLLLSPSEVETSRANNEFENPVMDESLYDFAKIFDVIIPEHAKPFFASAWGLQDQFAIETG